MIYAERTQAARAFLARRTSRVWGVKRIRRTRAGCRCAPDLGRTNSRAWRRCRSPERPARPTGAGARSSTSESSGDRAIRSGPSNLLFAVVRRSRSDFRDLEVSKALRRVVGRPEVFRDDETPKASRTTLTRFARSLAKSGPKVIVTPFGGSLTRSLTAFARGGAADDYRHSTAKALAHSVWSRLSFTPQEGKPPDRFGCKSLHVSPTRDRGHTEMTHKDLYQSM